MFIVVVDDSAGNVITVTQTVVSNNLQSLGLIHISDHGAAGEGVHHRTDSVRGLRSDPVGQLMLGADVGGDVRRQAARGVDGIVILS